MFSKKMYFRIKESFLFSVTFLFFIMFISNAIFADAGANFEAGPLMNVNRMGFHQITLADGKVVLFGGHGTGFTSLKTAEVWDPNSKVFTTLTMNYTHDSPAFAKLLDGRYLIAGGSSDLGVPAYANAEIFDPANNSFSPTGSTVRFRASSGAATLTSGKVLLAGAWYNHNDAYSYGELYDPVSGTFSATGALNTPRSSNYIFPTSDGKAVIFGGFHYTSGSPSYEQVELYDPISNGFTVLQSSLFIGETGWYSYNANNIDLDSIRLTNGKYLFKAYKSSGEHTLATFDPVAKTFTKIVTTPSLPTSTDVTFFPPVLNKTLNIVYLLGTIAGTNPVQLRLYTIDLASGSLTAPSGSHTLPADYYPGYSGISFLQDGRILLAGGHSQTGYNTNFSPINNTLFVTPIPTLFADNFENGSTIDATKWPSISGSSVTQTSGDLKIEQAQTDNGGKILSMAIPIANVEELIISKKVMAHYANNYFDGYMQLSFGQGAYFATSSPLSTITASYTNYSYSNSTERVVTGFHLGRYSGHFIQDIPTITPVWDTWFDEEIHYFTKTGVAEYYIDGVKKATVQLDVLSQNATHMKIEMGAWGWYTGHNLQIKDISVRANNNTSSTSNIQWTTNPANGNTYSVIDAGTWEQCETMAQSLDAHLVTVNNIEENNWLVQTFGNTYYWIGYTDKATEGIWKWASEIVSSYTNWNSGEPNNTHAGENYAMMNWGSNGSWNDLGPSSPEWNGITKGIIEKVNTQTTFTITSTAGAGGTISPSGSVSVVNDSNQTFTITANTGYTISDVKVDNISNGAITTYTFNNIASDHIIEAIFTSVNITPLTHTIIASAGNGGSISPIGNTSVLQGSNQTFTITPNLGYLISDVKVDNVSQGALTTYTFYNIASGHTIEAAFTSANITPLTYIITASAGNGGSITPTGNVTVNNGSNQTFTITANNGFYILDVKVDGISVGAVATYTFSNVTLSHTINATFATNSTGGTNTDGGSGKNGCIITSVTNNSSKNSFNEFKDKFMISTSAGKFITDLYYTISPKIINFIK